MRRTGAHRHHIVVKDEHEGPERIVFAPEHFGRAVIDGGSDLSHHKAVAARDLHPAPQPRAAVEADDAAVVDHGGIEEHAVLKGRAVGVFHFTEIGKFPVGRIADGDEDGPVISPLPLIARRAAIEIISSVISPHAVGRIEVGPLLTIVGRIFRREDDPRGSPIPEIVHGRRPYLIAEHAEGIAALFVVRAV